MTRILCLLLFALASGSLFGQGHKFGIKAGLNFNTHLGDAELDVNETNRESNKFAPGFHLGPVYNYEFTDKVGFQVELMYSQKGSKYRFFSDSAYYNLFMTPDIATSLTQLKQEENVWATGKKEVLLNVNTGYIAVPVSLFYNITPNLRIGGGVELDILVNATGTGQEKISDGVIRSGTTEGAQVDNFTVVYNHKYNKDVGGLGQVAVTDGQEMTVDGNSLPDPLYALRQIGAYPFELQDSNQRLYAPIDLSANFDLAYVFNTGLYFNVRASYGLLDISNNELDFSKLSLTDPFNGDLSRISRADRDVNFSIQASVGFNF